MDNGLLIVISGPSGAGKGTIYNKVIERLPCIKKSISVTTRKPRAGEIDGVHYHFKTVEQYQEMIARGDFLETASVYSNYYGTPKAPVFEMLHKGSDVMFEIDNFGAAQIKRKYPECITIYVMTPSFEVLEKRLKERNTETADSLNTRLSSARRELSEYKNFDFIVINDEVDNAVDKVISIIKSERCKISRNESNILSLLNEKKIKRSLYNYDDRSAY